MSPRVGHASAAETAARADSPANKTNKSCIDTVSLGHNPDGSRNRRTVRSRTKTQAKDRL